MGGPTVTTALRDHLAAELAKKVSQRGIVVWQDTDHEYADVAAAVCPPDARFVAYDGSWYALRRDVESLLAGETPPKLVVYAPGTSEWTTLEEIRAAGVRFAIKLATLVKNALKGQLSDERLAESAAKHARCADGAARRANDARTMALRILTGERADALDDRRAWSAAAELLAVRSGGRSPANGTIFVGPRCDKWL